MLPATPSIQSTQLLRGDSGRSTDRPDAIVFRTRRWYCSALKLPKRPSPPELAGPSSIAMPLISPNLPGRPRLPFSASAMITLKWRRIQGRQFAGAAYPKAANRSLYPGPIWKVPPPKNAPRACSSTKPANIQVTNLKAQWTGGKLSALGAAPGWKLHYFAKSHHRPDRRSGRFHGRRRPPSLPGNRQRIRTRALAETCRSPVAMGCPKPARPGSAPESSTATVFCPGQRWSSTSICFLSRSPKARRQPGARSPALVRASTRCVKTRNFPETLQPRQGPRRS